VKLRFQTNYGSACGPVIVPVFKVVYAPSQPEKTRIKRGFSGVLPRQKGPRKGLVENQTGVHTRQDYLGGRAITALPTFSNRAVSGFLSASKVPIKKVALFSGCSALSFAAS